MGTSFQNTLVILKGELPRPSEHLAFTCSIPSGGDKGNIINGVLPLFCKALSNMIIIAGEAVTRGI